jgi:DNA-directed RNA polymerase subunit L
VKSVYYGDILLDATNFTSIDLTKFSPYEIKYVIEPNLETRVQVAEAKVTELEKQVIKLIKQVEELTNGQNQSSTN